MYHTDREIQDPKLTPRGELQCREYVRENEEHAKHITHILVSPMTRALQTAFICFKDTLITMLATPELQNLDAGPNGTGKTLLQLKVYMDSKDFARDDDHNCNIPAVDVSTFGREDWNQKEYGTWSAENVQHRVNYVLGFLRGLSVTARPDEKTEVILVTHGSFMNRLINNAAAHYSSAKLTSHVFDNDGALREINEKELHNLRELWEMNEVDEEEEQTIKEQEKGGQNYVEKIEVEAENKGGSDGEKDVKDSDSQTCHPQRNECGP